MGVDYTQFANIPVPDENAVDDVPYWLTQFADVIDPQLVQYASDNADRDARYYLSPMGTVVVVVDSTPAVEGVYIKTSAPGSATWGNLYTAPAAIAWTNLAMATNITSLSSLPQISVEKNNQWANLTGDLQTIDTTTLVNGMTVATIPSQFIIAKTIRHPVAMNQVPGSWGTGYVVIDQTTGNINTWGITASAQPQWIDLSGVRFQCHL